MLAMHPAIKPELRKGETAIDAVERLRRRVRELKADVDRTRAAPWPSKMAKGRMRERIDELAEAAKPRVDWLIEHGEPLEFQNMSVQVSVAATDRPMLGFAEVPDVLGLLIWLQREAMIAALDRAIDEVADDEAALTLEQRQKAERQTLADLLATEREEIATIDVGRTRTQGMSLDYRSDSDPRAVLGIELVVER